MDTFLSRKSSHAEAFRAMEQSANSIIITNLQGEIEYVNPAFQKLTGYLNEEVLGKNPRFLKSGQTPSSTFQEMWRALSLGHQWQGEVLNRRKDGSLYWGFLTISPIHDDNATVVTYLGIEEDITERKSLETQLKNSNADLIDSIAAMKQFTNMLSHDLKAPLLTIRIALGLLNKILAEENNPKVNQLLKSSSNCAEQMLTLITEMTQFAKIGASQKSFEQVDLNEVLDQALANLEGAISRTKAEVKSEALPVLEGNRGLLVLLFQNLIENGIKYNESESPKISISVSKSENELIFHFKDNGIGISEDMIGRLFVPFCRLNSKSKYDGSGLGLAGCKKICEMHNGRVWIQPQKEQGCHFCVAFPFPKVENTHD